MKFDRIPYEFLVKFIQNHIETFDTTCGRLKKTLNTHRRRRCAGLSFSRGEAAANKK